VGHPLWVSITVRKPVVEDAAGLGRIHVRAWQTAYRGLMPDEYLDGLQVRQRAEMWSRNIEQGWPRLEVLVIEVDGNVAGFAAFGPEGGDLAQRAVGELFAINLDPSIWGRGLGRHLLGEVTKRLGRAGFAAAVLWVVPTNDRARRLYESQGMVC
jgi:ribosomal protein S18 acetylase RimI-like enzyme